MKKSISGIFAICFLLCFVSVAMAAVNKENRSPAKTKVESMGKSTKLSKSMIFSSESVQMTQQIIWQDDFESAAEHWIPDASWNHVELASGRDYQWETSWQWMNTNSHSATHSWNATEENDQELLALLNAEPIFPPDETETMG